MNMTSYTLHLPARRTTPVVFASPHSGRDYDPAFLHKSILDPHTIRSSEDAFVDQLFSAAPSFGAPLLAATTPRAYVDLNRAADELDPSVVEGVRRGAHNPRVASGLGRSTAARYRCLRRVTACNTPGTPITRRCRRS